MIVTLIGYRGTGKTTLAPRLAARWGWDWVDADVELERRTGRTIRDIFARDGEPEFRRLERQTLVDLLQRDRLVLAAGGGAVLNADTRRDLQAAGPVVWLQACAETIARRLAGDDSTAERRPNLTAAGGLDEIRTLLAQREPLYRNTATLMVATDGRTMDELADEIVRRLPWLVAAGERP
jgi:shikimate kinase